MKVQMYLVLIFVLCAGKVWAEEIEAYGKACQPVLVPDELKTEFKNDTESAFRDAMCGKWFKNHQEESSGGGKIEVFEIVGVGGEGKSSTKTVTRTEYCQNKEYHSTNKTFSSFFSRIVTSDARDKWLQCMNIKKAELESRIPSPVIIRASQNDDAGVAVTLSWDKNISIKQPVFAGFNNSNITCNGIKNGAKIPSGVGVTLNCKWSDGYPTHGMVIANLKGGNSVLATLKRDVPNRGTGIIEATKKARKVTGSKPVCTATVRTGNHHNERCHNGCTCTGDGKWCMESRTFSVSAESGDTAISGPYLECVQDNQGSCGWNGVNGASGLSISTNNGKTITASKAIGSRDISVRMCANQDTYGLIPETRTVSNFQVSDGYTFVAGIEQGESGVIKIKWNSGNEEVIGLGQSTEKLKLTNKAQTANTTYYTYQYLPPKSVAQKVNVPKKKKKNHS